MTLKEFIDKYALEIQTMRITFRTDVPRDQWNDSAKHYAFTIHRANRYGVNRFVYQGYYSQGSALSRPQGEDILNALIMDTLNIEQGFRDWCSEYGYSDDSIKAHKIYSTCLDEYEQLKKLFNYNELKELYECETL